MSSLETLVVLVEGLLEAGIRSIFGTCPRERRAGIPLSQLRSLLWEFLNDHVYSPKRTKGVLYTHNSGKSTPFGFFYVGGRISERARLSCGATDHVDQGKCQDSEVRAAGLPPPSVAQLYDFEQVMEPLGALISSQPNADVDI